jgi:uncharacterized protein
MKTKVNIPHDQLAEFCRRHNIRKMSYFGSLLRDDFREDSDIDILVEFDADSPVTLLDMGGMQVELSELFGRFVDLKTPGFLSRYFRQKVLDSAVVAYERK